MIGRRLCVAIFVFIAVIGAQAKPCPPFKVYGLIVQRWATLGGADGFLGCPTSDETSVPGSRARFNTFERGMVVWSPDQGPNMVVSAYWRLDPGNPPYRIFVEWGDSAPFHYDFFLVRPNAMNRLQTDAPLDEQWEIHSGGSRGSSDFIANSGQYAISIEGCDSHGLAPSKCHQGWTTPARVAMPLGIPIPGVAPMEHPTITVTGTISGQTETFVVKGKGFKPGVVTLRVTNTRNLKGDLVNLKSVDGTIMLNQSFPCEADSALAFVATDGTHVSNKIDLTGQIWSNTVTVPCP
jgi:hypothetical protein